MRFTIALLALIGASAYAAPPEVDEVEETDEVTGRKVKYLERTELDLEGVELQGELLGPNVRWIHARRQTRFPALVELRDNWKTELAESVDQVK